MVRFMRLGLELPRVGFGDRRNETQSSRDRHRRRDKVLSFAAISTSQRMRRQAQIEALDVGRSSHQKACFGENYGVSDFLRNMFVGVVVFIPPGIDSVGEAPLAETAPKKAPSLHWPQGLLTPREGFVVRVPALGMSSRRLYTWVLPTKSLRHSGRDFSSESLTPGFCLQITF
ncbi:hypothetical protein YC2023_065873 [Brassica napus]